MAIRKGNVAFIKWLLGHENNRAFREEQLQARATGYFFSMYVFFYVFYNEHFSYCSSSRISAANRSTMVKHHWHSLVVPISGRLLRFYLNMVLRWTRLVAYVYGEILAIFLLSFRWTVMEILYYIYLSFIICQISIRDSKSAGYKKQPRKKI